MLLVNNIEVIYDHVILVLKGVSLEVPEGGIVALLGANGAGFDIMAKILGEMPDVRTATYFTDAAALTPVYGGPPTVILGPGEAAMAHQTDEYCVVNRIDQAVDAYVEIAKRWNAT